MPPIRDTPARDHLERLRKEPKTVKIHTTLALTAVLGALASISSVEVAEPVAKHTSMLSGQMWLEEILYGHPDRCHTQFGMSTEVFGRLLTQMYASGLHDSRWVSAAEQLAIFLYFARHNSSQRVLMERFQRSADTISKAIHQVTNILVSTSFYGKYVKCPTMSTAPQIRNNPKLFPFFRHAIGAIDGSHIAAHVLAEDMPRYRSRKGMISQNILAVCDWFLLFTYVLAGWEGSAADSAIFESARTNGAFTFGRPWYFLADAGFPICDTLLVPYRNTCYHLKEWMQASRLGGTTPENAKELFNLRHSQARNVIERIFGAFKRHFKILNHPPEFPIQTQARFVLALSALFNFIRNWDPSDIDEGSVLDTDDLPQEEGEDDEDSDGTNNEADPIFGGVSDEETRRATLRRDHIAQAMWEDYSQFRSMTSN